VKHFVLASTTDFSAVDLTSSCKILLNGWYELVKTVAAGDGKSGRASGGNDGGASGGGSDGRGGTTRGSNDWTTRGGSDGRLGGDDSLLASGEGGGGQSRWRWARGGFCRA
jgi:hypothetical protein